ncbi:MAG: TrpB-like pyridoxal phosphate-dependent enzyme [Candidatus Goldbacteria bacterium]|nr:TrpB-like pyridoxal phosphate-dependent enzyme [Candidatus Goldiibacteriota bacterium]
MSDTRKFILQEKDIPSAWYNIIPDLPTPLDPPLNPGTGKPLGPEDLAPIFPMALIEQEMSPKQWIDIPGEVIDILKLWRPSPLIRARGLEKLLDTPARIYYKYEGVSPAGSHKSNTAIAQAYYNKKEGVKKLSTETGAGQWGSALSLAGAMMGIEVEVYMVRVSYDAKPYRKLMMETWGAKVYPSPTKHTEIGKKILEQNPDSLGSLGIAISEAVEVAAKDPHTKYALGSVLNHVALHQTVIGLEAKKQMEMAGDYPDVVIACHGGGSNFAGTAFPFAYDKMKGNKKNIRLIAAEPAACPTLTKGRNAYDFGDTGEMTPLLMMYTLGHKFMPSGIHAGGLRYHGASPLVSNLLKNGVIEAVANNQTECFDAAIQFAKTEGIIPAPESTHAIRVAINEALDAKAKGEKRVILFNLSGHGNFDFAAYEAYLTKKMKDVPLPQSDIDKGFESLPKL